MHDVVPVEAVVGHVAVHDVVIDHDHRATRTVIDAAERDIRPRVVEPAVPAPVTLPPVVVDHAAPPIEIVAEPSADRVPDAERPVRRAHAEVVDRAIVDHLGVIDGHVDHRRLRRHDADRLAFDLHPLLSGGDEVSLLARHMTQALHARHHVARLQGIRAADRRRPVGAFGEHVQHRLIACDRLHAHVPGLIVDADRAVGRHIAGGELHLVRIRRRDQQLRQDRVRIERDGREEVVEFLDRVELFVLNGLRPGGRLLRSDRGRESERAGGAGERQCEAEGCGGTGHSVSCVTVYPVVPWRRGGVPGSSTRSCASRYEVHSA